jgi:superfamily I DNA and/or RNA helicase
LDSLIARDDGSEIVADVRKDIDKLQKELAKRGKRYDRAQRREMQAEMRVLRKEVRKREEAVVREIMQSRQVILCTCTTASSRLIRDMEFDFVIIDEAAQAMEVACWIPLSKTRKCILVGDHNQVEYNSVSHKSIYRLSRMSSYALFCIFSKFLTCSLFF